MLYTILTCVETNRCSEYAITVDYICTRKLGDFAVNKANWGKPAEAVACYCINTKYVAQAFPTCYKCWPGKLTEPFRIRVHSL